MTFGQADTGATHRFLLARRRRRLTQRYVPIPKS